jgi:hypothetical protein
MSFGIWVGLLILRDSVEVAALVQKGRRGEFDSVDFADASNDSWTATRAI